MVEIIEGKDIGKQGKVEVAGTGALFDREGAKILLVQRSSNKRWQLPGGHMEAGQSVADTCVREVREEIGLEVEAAFIR